MGADRHRKVAFTHAVARAKVPGRARQTGMVLAYFMGADGVAWVGQRRLRDEWDIGAKRLRVDVAELVRVGLLEVLPRSGPHGASLHRSCARFIGETADIVLDNGELLVSARAPGHALNDNDTELARASGHALDSDQEPPARASGHALNDEAAEGPARAFGESARAFEQSARASGHANHHSTTPPVGGGGGGGGAVPAAATADAAAAGPAEERARSSIDAVLDELETLVGGKVVVPRFNQRLNGLISAKIDEGWEPASLARVVLDNPPPVKPVSDPAAWWSKRLSGVQMAPVCVHARATPAGAPAAQKPAEKASRLREEPAPLFITWHQMMMFALKEVDRSFLEEFSHQTAVAILDYDDRPTCPPAQLFKAGPESNEEPMRQDCAAVAPHMRAMICLKAERLQLAELRAAAEGCSWRELVVLAMRVEGLKTVDGSWHVVDGNRPVLTEESRRSLEPGGLIHRFHIEGRAPIVYSEDDACEMCGSRCACEHRRNGGVGVAERS